MENTISFREAIMDDFPRVMAIAEIYSGADYLPSVYEATIKSSHSKCYVSVANGDIVAFVIGTAVDGGETLVTRAGRVNDRYKGQGIYGALTKFVREQMAASGRIKYETFTTHTENFDANKDKITTSYREILHKNVICYRYKGTDAKRLPTDLTKTPKHLQPPDLEKAIYSEITCKHLFPNNRMILDWIPLRSLPSNVEFLSPDMLMLGSCSAERSNSDVMYTCLTIGSHYHCKLGLEYSVDVFGDDVGELRNHILVHMENVFRLAGDLDYEIAIIFPPSIVPDIIDSMLCDINMPTPVRKQDELLYLLEKPFQ